jgi:hypothetical protein
VSAFIFAELAQSTAFLQDKVGVSPPIAAVGLLYLLNGVLAYSSAWRYCIARDQLLCHPSAARHHPDGAGRSPWAIPIVNLHDLLLHYQESFRIPEWAWLLIIGPLALLLLQRLHELVVDVADRFLNRRFHAARRQLEDAGQCHVERAKASTRSTA